jgi:probable F420-dependent oxidoreductase
MRVNVGLIFPQTEIGPDPSATVALVRRAEALGYSHITLYDHVVGAVHDGRVQPLTEHLNEEAEFHEPLVTLAYVAALTERMCLMTGVLVLPQRQTVLVAKQAAQLALLSNGRFRLGVGTGWNYVEYESLNERFADRGGRLDEQVELLRRLWAEPIVDFSGAWHRVDRVGLRPLPGPIPIWFGGSSERAFRRAVRLGDGFVFRNGGPAKRMGDIRRVAELLNQSGRSKTEFGLDVQVDFRGDTRRWREDVISLQAEGVDTVSLRTLACGFSTPEEHISAIEEYREAIDDLIA